MSRKEIEELSDEKIEELLATKVMHWIAARKGDSNTWCWVTDGSDIVQYGVKEGDFVIGTKVYGKWSPLTNWNHTWQVVKELENFTNNCDEGFEFGLESEDGQSLWTAYARNFDDEQWADHKDPQRAICMLPLIMLLVKEDVE